MKRKTELRLRIKAVTRAMRETWNPIGFDDHLPADEYESYAPVVVGMFERGESDRTVAEHLRSLESEAIGFTPRSVDELVEIVRVLRAAT